jgi:hypothetical protein
MTSQPLWIEELKSERGLLAKADRDIEQGWLRWRRQQQVVARFRVCGRPSQASDQLLAVTSQILVEWEKHRGLIAQRIAYLEARLSVRESA